MCEENSPGFGATFRSPTTHSSKQTNTDNGTHCLSFQLREWQMKNRGIEVDRVYNHHFFKQNGYVFCMLLGYGSRKWHL